MENLTKVLVSGGITLALGLIGYLLMLTDKVTNPTARMFNRWFVLGLTPLIIIFGLITVGYMLQ